MPYIKISELVIDDEICGNIFRILRGFEVNNETLALDVIGEVVHGGNYLSCEHTLRHFRKEHYITSLTDRSTRDLWERAGSKDIRERSRDRVKEILSSHHPSPMDEARTKALEEAVKEVFEREGEKLS